MKPRKAKRKRQAASRSPATPPSGPTSRPSGRFRGWRGWLLRLSLLVISPIVFVGILEVGLRVGHYGYPTGFFIGPSANGVYTTNDRFGWRFFPPSLSRAPQPCFLSEKPANTVRIFVLGSSAAMGTPEPSFNFGRILEVMLRHRYPGVQFEVVNAAMTAINSHVALQIAKDCAAHQPDMFVVYLGNNEVVGPYGPGTVFQKWSPNLTLVRAAIWAKSLRLGQLVGNVLGHFHGDDNSMKQWHGMEMFLNKRVTADDPRLTKVYENLRANLVDLCRVAHRAGAPVILATVAVNLQDCPPLASVHRADLSEGELAKWDSVYKAGVSLETAGRTADAVKQYEAAAQIDPGFADLQFRIARCLAKEGQTVEACQRYSLARDLDALRFRADSYTNEAIREVAAMQQADGVYLADAEKELSAEKLARERLFYEHVHLTFDGNYLLARTVLDQVAQALPESIRARATGEAPTLEECAKELVLTRWDQYNMNAAMAKLASSPPFTDQLDHAARQAAIFRRVEELRRLIATPAVADEATQAYRAAIDKAPDDWELHQRFALFLMWRGRYDESAKHWQAAIEKRPSAPELYACLGNALREGGRLDEAVAAYEKSLALDPNHIDAHLGLGEALLRQKKVDEAIAQFQKALEIDPQSVDAYGQLGVVLLEQGKTDDGIANLKKAVELSPANPNNHRNMAIAMSRMGNDDEAALHYRKVLEVLPEDAISHGGLGLILANRGSLGEAVAHYERALAAKPDDAETHFNCGVAMAELGRAMDAISHYQASLRLRPDNAEAHNNLAILMVGQGHLEDAIAHFRKAVAITPQAGNVHLNLGMALYRQGRAAEAVRQWREGVRVCPDYAPLLNQAANILATCDDPSIRNGTEAVQLAEKAVKLSGSKDPVMLDTLAAAYAEAGRFPEAIATAQHAASLASDAGNTALAETIRNHVKLYQSGSPLRDSTSTAKKLP